ncbi:MAG: two pore domain potassium channel family protein [Firmicutes bacterium]|nr:two pore domain potassium channel family protein [Bacillota bacterium]
MTENKRQLKLVSHSGYQFRYRFLLVSLALFALLAYSFTNTFIQLPFAAPAAVLSIVSGLSLMTAVFLGFFPRNRGQGWMKPAPDRGFRYLFLGWVLSVFSIVVGYSSLYTELYRRVAGSFAGELGGITSVYFSVVTFATVGYGDIYPTASLSRILVMSEILIPVILLPLVLAISIFWVINRNQSLKADAESKPRNPYTRIK